MSAGVALAVLGGLTARRADVPVTLGGPKSQRILAVLVANRNRPTSVDRLVDTLWGDEPPASSTAIVQSHISRLRSALGPEIDIRRAADGYALQVPDELLDATRFERLIGAARRADPAGSVALLDEAIGLWWGPAFGEHAGLDHVRAEAVRLDELRLVALDDWATARLTAGEAASLVGDLEALVDRYPLQERFWVLLMLALHRTGRQAEALRRAHDLREMLGREVGLDVSGEIRDLETRILADDPSLRPPIHRSPPSPTAAGIAASRLMGSTSFVGREPDVAGSMVAIADHQVVTVTGPGGVGKTRLALRAAAGLVDEFGGEVTVVEFAPLRDPAGAIQVIAHALDIQQRQHRTLVTTIEEYLAPRRSLLVLDNCEHVTEVVAPLVDRLRSHCPELRILATSRRPLGLPGEYVMVVPPLSLPAPDDETLDAVQRSTAVELFVARASAAVPGFALTDQNVAAVAGICRRLDGLPLGLELAAARLRAMGVEALADRLDRRVQLLGQLQHSSDGRQRTLVDLVRWSYDLLEPSAQQMFLQLAVFAGGFDLAAAESICHVVGEPSFDPVETLATLVEHSMVILVDPGIPRYRLLEPLREFASERLADDGLLDEVEDRHLEWYHDLAGRGAVGLDTAEEAAWSAQIDRDFDNFRAAHHRAVAAGDLDRAVELVVGLREFGCRRVQYEMTSWAEESAALPGAQAHPQYPTLLAMGGYRLWVRGDLEAAIAQAHRALDAGVPGELSASGLPERVLGNAHFYLGDPEAGLRWMERMFQSACVAGDDPRRAHGLYMRSVALTSVGDNVRGAIVAGEARAAAELVGSPTALAQAAYALGLALEGTDRDEALGHLERAAALAGAAGNRWIEAFALTEVYWLRARRGEHVAGLTGFGDVVRTWYRGGDWANQWLSLRHVFGILIDLGAFEEAAVLHGALTAVGASHALPFEPADAARLSEVVEELRSLLGAGTFAEAVRRGTAMTDSEIVEFVIDHIDALTAA